MPDLTEVLLRLAEPPLAPPEPLDGLERRVHLRRRRRRLARTGLAIACAVVVGVPAVGVLAGRSGRPPVVVETSQTTVATVPQTPDRPSGRLVPTWLPGDLRIATEEEREVVPDAVAGAGSTRSYTRSGPTGQTDRLILSLQVGAAPIDIDAEVGRYAGARRVEVHSRPALLLPIVPGRTEATVAWSPNGGQLAQVRGVGLSDDELLTVAQRLVPFGLDQTPVPEGFQGSGGRPSGALPPPVPRRYQIATTPLRGPATNPSYPVPAVRVVAVWNDPLPPGVPETVRGRPASLSTAGADTTLAWFERPGLLVTVTGTNLRLEDVVRVATGLREQSLDEVVSRPGGARVLLGRGQLAGGPYELWVTGGPGGLCLELTRQSVAHTCRFDLTATISDLPISIALGVAFGPVVPTAATVRLELAGGRAVETPAIGADSGQGAAFYVTDLPADFGSVVAVVALGPNGQVLRRTLVE